MIGRLRNYWINDSGAPAAECALIASLIAVGAIAAMTSFGGRPQTTCDTVAGNLATH